MNTLMNKLKAETETQSKVKVFREQAEPFLNPEAKSFNPKPHSQPSKPKLKHKHKKTK